MVCNFSIKNKNPMKRRYFITTAALAVPALTAAVAGGENPTVSTLTGSNQRNMSPGDPLVAKAMIAMLCMQRMAWEQGTASQALIAIGRKDLAVLFARDALVRQTQDGRLGILGNDPG
jgi:hypothetical protein